jgi:hypothetical protein
MRYHGNTGGSQDWITCKEFRLGAGVEGRNRIDLWAIHTNPSQGNKAITYEVKISRGDFLRDVKDPTKHAHARLFSDAFYYAAPRGMLKLVEIPDWAGLIEVGPEDEPIWTRIKKVKEAPILTKHSPSWPVMISLLRRVPDGAGNAAIGSVAVRDDALLSRLLFRIEKEANWLGGADTAEALRRLMGRAGVSEVATEGGLAEPVTSAAEG